MYQTFEYTNDIVLILFYLRNTHTNKTKRVPKTISISTIKIIFLKINIAYLFPTES